MEEINRFFRTGAILPRLILINAGVWLAIGIMKVFSFLFKVPDSTLTSVIVDFLALPADISQLSVRPWTLFTYMFLHIDFFHLLFNMLWLFWFGKILLEFMSSRQLLVIYILGGLSGGLLYILFYNVFPVFEKSVELSVALGASASVMAIVTAISLFVPGYVVHLFLIGKVRIFFIALFLFVLDFFMIRSNNSGGHIAHIGGALFGVFFILFSRKGMNFKGFWNFTSLNRFFRRFSRKKLRVEYTNPKNTGSRPLTDDEYNALKVERQKKTDELLDRIKKSGYESLSKEEKDFLFKAGNSGN